MTTRRSLASLFLVLISAPALAQGVFRFDMGPSGQETVPLGFAPVSTVDAYPKLPTEPTDPPPHGWVQFPGGDFVRTPFAYVPTGHLNQDLVLDGSTGGSIHFRVDVPDGDYRVVLHLGDPLDTTDPGLSVLEQMRTRMSIRLEDVPVVGMFDVRTLSGKGTTDDPYGGYRRIHLSTSVSDETLDIELTPGSHSRTSVLGIEIYAEQPEPLRLSATTHELEAHASFGTTFDTFLTHLHAGDFADARTAATEITDPLASAYAASWLAGWLTGAEQDFDVGLINHAMTELTSLSPDDVRVATLLAECKDVLQANNFYQWMGYSLSSLPGVHASIPDPVDPSKGYVVANLSANAMLLEQAQSDLYGPIAAGQPQSPLFFRSQLLICRNHYSRATKLGDPEAEFQEYWFDIIAALWDLDPVVATPEHELFPHEHTLAMFAFMEEHYSQMEGGIIENWGHDLPTIPTNYDPSLAWWAPMVFHTDDESAPIWANSQRSYYRAFRAIGDWWMANRFYKGEIGGGAGDDVEGAGLLAQPALMLKEPDSAADQDLSVILEKVLFGPKVDQNEGYADVTFGCGDVEHNAEYTTNPYLFLLPANYGNPKHWQLAHLTMRNFANQLGNSWSTVTGDGDGFRQFKGWSFDATAVCPPVEDVPMNMRAILPGFQIIDYSAHPLAIQLFEELAVAWVAHLMSSEDSKPIGVFPAAVNHDHPTPSFGPAGGGGWWDTSNALFDLGPDNTANQEYLYSLAHTMYVHSNDIEFLKPALEGAHLVKDFIDGGGIPGAIGSEAWAADVLKSVIANAVAAARPFFVEGVNATAGDIAAMDAVIDEYAGSWAKFMLDPAKDKTELEIEMAKAVDWVHYFLPLSTTAVSYTDRVHLFAGGAPAGSALSHHTLFQAMTGGGIQEGYPVSWSNPDPEEGELDVAILVLSATQDGMEALLFNFDTTPRDILLRLMRGFGPGVYSVKLGIDDDHDDEFDGALVLNTTFSLLSKSSEFVFNLPEGALYKLELERTSSGASFAVLPDLAIGDEDLDYDGGNDKLSVTVHNLGTKRIPVGTATFDVFVDGSSTAAVTVPIPELPKNLDFNPISTTLEVPGLDPQTSVRVVLHMTPSSEITTANNEAVIQIRR